jgi:CheY-like chemotaxis protein
VSRDPESLKAWYRQAMVRRIQEIRALRNRLALADAGAANAARKVAQQLRGSGGTFGFPELSEAAGMVESARDEDLPRSVEGLLEVLFSVSAPAVQSRAVRAEWLVLAAGLQADGAPFADVPTAWREVAHRGGLSSGALAARAASRLGLQVADLGRASRAPLRLVPEALVRRELLVPLAEDSATITVASADPTSLALERELGRLTGRTPVFALAPPDALQERLEELLAVPEPSSAAHRRAAPGASEAGGPQAAARVLVVDDDPASRLLVRTVLGRHGFEVVEAADGVEGLHRLKRDGPVALVVADLDMPHLDGLELLWEIRESQAWADLPVLVLTGQADPRLETRLIEEGADDYLCKPLEPRLFLARVQAILRRGRA